MDGHASSAGGARGANPVCAGVTALARSCAEALATHEGVAVRGTAPGPGAMDLVVDGVGEAEVDWLRGVTDVLVGGCRRLARDAPDEVDVRVET